MTTPHFSLNKAHLMALIGNIVTALVAFVPQWSGEKTVIIAALGGVISNTYPLVNAGHAVVTVIKQLLAQKLTPQELRMDAISFLHDEVGRIDFKGLANDAIIAVQSGNINALTEEEIAKLKSFLTNLTSLSVPSQIASTVQQVPPATTI